MLNKNLSLYKNGLNEMLRPSNYRLVAEIQFSLSIPTRVKVNPVTPINFQLTLSYPGSRNPILPGGGGEWGASEDPRVKSQHSGLPDDPMPYNDNYILCLGIN